MSITQEIYNNLTVEAKLELLNNLNPKDKGNRLELDCPNCKEHRAYLYHNGHQIICNRAGNCSYSSSLFDYTQQKNSISDYDALKLLADKANIPLEMNTYDEKKHYQQRDNIAALEQCQAIFTSKLFQKEGKETFQYLVSRGYSQDEIKTMELGHYPNTLSELLKNQNIDTTHLRFVNQQELGYSHFLTIPYRDHKGILNGFAIRAITETQNKKYRYTAGLEVGKILLNLYRHYQQHHIILVEGVLDALIAEARGMTNVVAMGGHTLKELQSNLLKKIGVKTAVLLLDNDEAGIKGSFSTIKRLRADGISAFVTQLDNAKDLDEFLKTSSSEALQTKIASSVSAIEWEVNQLKQQANIKLLGHDNNEEKLPPLVAECFINHCLDFDAKLTNPLEKANLLDKVIEYTDIRHETLEEYFETHRQAKVDNEKRKQHEKLNIEVTKLIKNGEHHKLDSLYQKELSKINSQPEPSHVKNYEFEDIEADLKSRPEGLLTGIKELDKYVSIQPEALSIICARPGHGKTTMLLNICMNMIEKYPDKSFAFFSYEEPRLQIFLKMLSIKSAYSEDNLKHLLALEKKLRDGNANQKSLDAKAELIEMLKSNRLWIIESCVNSQVLSQQIRHMKKNHPNLSGVFIDYIQKIKAPKSSAERRQLELQKISDDLLSLAKDPNIRIPIILAAQNNREAARANSPRQDHIRESGDIEQDANLVLHLEDPSQNDTSDKSDKKELNPERKLKITTVKNRNGRKDVTVTVNLSAHLFKISNN